MRYMLLIHSDEVPEAAMTPEEEATLMAAYGEFTQALTAEGALVTADRLRPTSEAVTVRVRDGEALETDGPFAETKEQFGGYYLIDVPDLAAAKAWAARVPSAAHGSVEVRPVWELS